MELLIVSGMSGAGKSVAMNALEDIGFFCIDNVPAGLLPSIMAFSKAGDMQLQRVALSMDVRGCRSKQEIEQALEQLDQQGVSYKILFLDAPDEVLMRRYSATRRLHPISIAEGISMQEAFERERRILKPLQEHADYSINTELLSTAQNKERICDLFLENGGSKAAMRLTILSFGFKYGLPKEADLVLDVRCLPNPFYVPELKHKTGLDEEVVDYVMASAESQELLKRYESFLECALPLYVKEGKSQLTIAIGCTGGKHRSITFVRRIAAYCEKLGYQPNMQHRDVNR
ncbi:MAG: RNase adapter RapZ [Faecalibacterium sp.]